MLEARYLPPQTSTFEKDGQLWEGYLSGASPGDSGFQINTSRTVTPLIYFRIVDSTLFQLAFVLLQLEALNSHISARNRAQHQSNRFSTSIHVLAQPPKRINHSRSSLKTMPKVSLQISDFAAPDQCADMRVLKYGDISVYLDELKDESYKNLPKIMAELQELDEEIWARRSALNGNFRDYTSSRSDTSSSAGDRLEELEATFNTAKGQLQQRRRLFRDLLLGYENTLNWGLSIKAKRDQGNFHERDESRRKLALKLEDLVNQHIKTYIQNYRVKEKDSSRSRNTFSDFLSEWKKVARNGHVARKDEALRVKETLEELKVLQEEWLEEIQLVQNEIDTSLSNAISSLKDIESESVASLDSQSGSGDSEDGIIIEDDLEMAGSKNEFVHI